MENVRYRLASTSNKNKSSTYDMTAARVNASAFSRQGPAADDRVNHHHPGRRQWSRRRDIYAVPDDIVHVSTPVADALRRRADCPDTLAKSPTLWAQPTSAVDGRTLARSRSRPRPLLLLEPSVQRGQMSGVNDSVTSRYVEHRITDDYQRQRRYNQRQQQQLSVSSAGGLTPSVEFGARCAVDSRPQMNPNPTSPVFAGTVTSPTSPTAPSSQSYLNDNKTLLKEAIMSAAVAKLSRSASAKSASVRPLVVVRNGPAKSSSDEHVDADDDVAVKSPASSDRTASPTTPEQNDHNVDVAVAAAAAAATTRRSRTRRREADQTTSVVTTSPAAVATSARDAQTSNRSRPTDSSCTAARDQVARNSVAVSSASETKPQDSIRPSKTRVTDSIGSPSAASQIPVLSRRNQLQGDKTPSATPTLGSAETLRSSMKKPGVDNRKEPQNMARQQVTSDTLKRDTPSRRVDKTTPNDSNAKDGGDKKVVVDAELRHESPSSASSVSFIKTMLLRTRSPSPSRCRRSRSRVQQTSPSPSSVKRIGTEVAQRISEPFKGYLKQIRERSSSRRRQPTESTAATVAANNDKTVLRPELPAPTSLVDSKPSPNNTSQSTGSDNCSSDDVPTRGRKLRTETKKTEGGTAALTSHWKSTSELTTPMSRLDNLLKANSLQHLKTSPTAASKTARPLVEQTNSTSATPSSPRSVMSKTSQSTGCLLSSPTRTDTPRQQSGDLQRATTMSRCYLEKPPRAARRAVTIQLDRRDVDQQPPSLSVTERQFISQGDVRQPQPATTPSADKETAESNSTKDDDDDDVSSRSTDQVASVSSRKLHAGSDASTSHQGERDLRELYEQKRLERQLEEKLALMEKERAETIAKLWSQIDRRREADATTMPRQVKTVIGSLRNSSAAPAGIVLPLSDNTSSTERNRQVASADPLGDLLIELSSTPTSTRWSERRRVGRASGAASAAVQLRPRAASCSRRLMSDSTAATAASAASLPSKSLSHTQLHRRSSGCSDLARVDSGSVQLRHRSSQQLQQSTSARPLTCYLPVRDRDLDLRAFIEAAGHHLEQCVHVQLTASTCHGYLSKLNASGAVRQWKRRWFVFDRAQRCLHYYTDKTEKRSDGAFIWFQTIQDVFVDHERRSRSARPECTFCVKTVERTLFLIAPTPETMRIWIDVIFTGAEGYEQFRKQ